MIFLLSGGRSARAQTPLGSERQDVNDFRGDIWSVWTAPAHTDARVAAPLAASFAITGLTTLADSSIYVWMTSHPGSPLMRVLRPLREGWKLPLYELGSGQYLLPLSGALYTAGRLSRRASLRDAGLGCAAGHLSSAGLRELFYVSVARARPRVTPSPHHASIPGRRSWDWHSFLSGHVANSMSCASFFAHRYSLGIGEPAMYAYVTAIGLGRMADGRHWASDTVAGAILGFAIGKALADRQDSREQARASRSRSGVALPIVVWRSSF